MLFGVALALSLIQAPDVIRVPVRLVAVPTLVFSKDNRLIPGLKKADFRLLDNGVPQTLHLDPDVAPVSFVIAIEADRDLHYIAKVGSTMEALLVGATGRAAVIAYNNDIKLRKPFGSGDMHEAFAGVKRSGSKARMIDAGLRAIDMLKDRPRTAARVLLFVNQSADHGSQRSWADLKVAAGREDVSVYSLNSFEDGSLHSLVAETGGTELHFHSQKELEDAIGMLGVELRSAYLLSFYPSSNDPGLHKISVEVSVPGAKAHARPEYLLSPN